MSVYILNNEDFVSIAVYAGAVGVLSDRATQTAFAEDLKALNLLSAAGCYGTLDAFPLEHDIVQSPISIAAAEEVLTYTNAQDRIWELRDQLGWLPPLSDPRLDGLLDALIRLHLMTAAWPPMEQAPHRIRRHAGMLARIVRRRAGRGP